MDIHCGYWVFLVHGWSNQLPSSYWYPAMVFHYPYRSNTPVFIRLFSHHSLLIFFPASLSVTSKRSALPSTSNIDTSRAAYSASKRAPFLPPKNCVSCQWNGLALDLYTASQCLYKLHILWNSLVLPILRQNASAFPAVLHDRSISSHAFCVRS